MTQTQPLPTSRRHRFRRQPGEKAWVFAAIAGGLALALMIGRQIVGFRAGEPHHAATAEKRHAVSSGMASGRASLAASGTAPRHVAGGVTASSQNTVATTNAKNRAPSRPDARGHDESSLTLEVVRLDAGRHNQDDPERFLVTSLSAPLRVPPVSREDGISHRASSDRWNPVRWVKTPGNIQQARWAVAEESPSGDVPLQIRLTSSAGAQTLVCKPKLRCEMLLLNRAVVGDCVTMRLVVTNIGTTTIENVRLHVDLPQTLSYHAGRRLEHLIGRLEPGQTHVARLTPTAQRDGTATITCRAIGRGVAASAEARVRIASRLQSRAP